MPQTPPNSTHNAVSQANQVASRVVGELPINHNTAEGHAKSVEIYNLFAADNGFLPFCDLTSDYLETVTDDSGKTMLFCLFSRFATWILLETSGKRGKGYKPDSIKQHFSQFKTALGKKFRSLDKLHTDTDWYKTLYNNVKIKASRREFEKGNNVSDGSASIWRTILISLCLYLLSENQKYNGYFNRALICSLYHALGRAGELALNAWPSVEYNTSLLAPQLMWKEFKTGKSCPISFFPDFCSYLIDWCHCMFCYLVSDGSDSYSTQSSGVPDGNTFLFPSLRHKDQNAIARDVTALLHKVAKTGKVVGLTQKHSSQGFKHGAADDCSFNSNCPVPSTVARAGWDYSGEGMIFYYIFKAFHVATAGKTLAGWKIPKNDVFPPDCKAFLTDYNVDQYEAFCKTLFSGVRVPDLHDISRLKAFRDQMVATFLMYMPEYEEDLGGNDQVLNMLFLMNCSETRLMEGFVLESDPPGVHLQHHHGKLVLRNGKPGSNESSEILWRTDQAYDYDGDTDLTWSQLSEHGNLAVLGQQNEGLTVLWQTESRYNHGDFSPVDNCFLSWLPSEERLVVNSGERNSPGPEIWTSKDFTWEPLHPNLSPWKQETVLVLTRISASVSTCGSGLIIFIIISRWKKKRAMNSTRDRVLFFMSLLDFLSSISHVLDVTAIPSDSYGIIGAIGNQATCSAQGFFIQMGFGVPLYNCMICFYALLIIRFNMSDNLIATRIEPFMHLIALGFAFVTASIGAYLQLYNSNGSFCWIEPYPMYCDDIVNVKCLRGENARLFQWMFAGITLILSWLIITITTAYIFFYVRQNRRTMQRRYGRTSVNTNQHIEVGKQAILYVFAFAITFSWPMAITILRNTGDGVPFWLNALQSFFFPLQGFWNVVIFLRPTFNQISHQHKERSFVWKLRATIRKLMHLKNPQTNTSSRKLQPSPSLPAIHYRLNSNSLSPISSQVNNKAVGSSVASLHTNLEDSNLAFIRYHSKFTSTVTGTRRGDVLDDDRIEKSLKRASKKLDEGGKEDSGIIKRLSRRANKKPNIDSLMETHDLGEEVCFREDAFSTPRKDLDHEKVEKAFKRASLKIEKTEASEEQFQCLSAILDELDDIELSDGVQSNNIECIESSSTGKEDSSHILWG